MAAARQTRRHAHDERARQPIQCVICPVMAAGAARFGTGGLPSSCERTDVAGGCPGHRGGRAPLSARVRKPDFSGYRCVSDLPTGISHETCVV
ncbi:MAG TPA: hypothetical protein DEF43_15735 [Chloroflexus aurantiacus]|nr:MAG: hypothetical protein D6716_13970 [Chloroflexota bacterium]HBW68565.1 hypothetical protein [Chloroflexus aurantiacus]